MTTTNLNSVLKPITLSTDDLIFDPTNPRLFELGDPKDCAEVRYAEQGIQEGIYQNLLDNYEVRDLAKKIKSIGLLKTDRIIVRKWKGPTSKYVVVEGNRRVCAMKFLRNEHKSGEEISADILADISNPEALLVDEAGKVPEELAELFKILQAARHIGPTVKSWGPYQQAKMIAGLKSNGKKTQTAADMLGISAKEANALWRGYHALEKMHQDEDYKDHADPSLFSYFYEALKVPAVKEWLEWSDTDERFKNARNVGFFYGMITKEDDDTEKKLPMAIDVRKLGKVIGHNDSLRLLLSSGGTIDAATGLLDDDIFERDFEPTVKSCQRMLEDLSHEKVQNLSEANKTLLTGLSEKINIILQNHQKLSS
jgi:hypothetical protein